MHRIKRGFKMQQKNWTSLKFTYEHIKIRMTNYENVVQNRFTGSMKAWNSSKYLKLMTIYVSWLLSIMLLLKELIILNLIVHISDLSLESGFFSYIFEGKF